LLRDQRVEPGATIHFVNRDNPEDAILEALGAHEPSWMRRFTSEAELADLIDDRRRLPAVLARLVADPYVGLRVQQSGADHYWFPDRISVDRVETAPHLTPETAHLPAYLNRKPAWRNALRGRAISEQ